MFLFIKNKTYILSNEHFIILSTPMPYDRLERRIALISIQCIAIHFYSVFGDSSCVAANVSGYGSQNNCILQEIQATPLRVAFLDKQYVTQNQAAIDSATARGITYAFGKTCENAKTAVPEW